MLRIKLLTHKYDGNWFLPRSISTRISTPKLAYCQITLMNDNRFQNLINIIYLHQWETYSYVMLCFCQWQLIWRKLLIFIIMFMQKHTQIRARLSDNLQNHRWLIRFCSDNKWAMFKDQQYHFLWEKTNHDFTLSKSVLNLS